MAMHSVSSNALPPSAKGLLNIEEEQALAYLIRQGGETGKASRERIRQLEAKALCKLPQPQIVHALEVVS